MYKNLLSTKDIIKRFKNNCEVDLRIDLTVLKAQVHVIRMSKVITDIKRLLEITGISDADLDHILQNQQQILRKWGKISKNALNSTQSDDCDGIDALVLEWISQYKTKPAPLAIKSIAMNLADILRIYPYFIKPHVWTKIDEIFDQSNVTTNKQSCRPLSLLEILKKDGKRILMPETYNRFLKCIGENSTVEENSEKNSTLDINNKYVKQLTNSSDIIPSTSSSDFPPLMAINLDPENADTNVTTIEDEPVTYKIDQIKPNTLSTGQIKSKIIDDNNTECRKEEFVSIKEEAEDNETSKAIDLSAELISVKQEKEFVDVIEIASSEDESSREDPKVQLKNINISRAGMAEINKEDQIEINHDSSQKDKVKAICLGVNDKNEEHSKMNERLTETCVRKRLKEAGATYKQNEVDPSQNISHQEIKIENTFLTSINVCDGRNIALNVKNEENYEILEIEDPNGEMNDKYHEAKNLHPIKYVEEDVNIFENAVKQEPIEESQFDNFEISTFSDLFSDDDETGIKTNTNLNGRLESQLKNQSFQRILEQRPKNLKRSIKQSNDDLPSTSQSTILNYHPHSSQFCKKLCQGITKAENATDLSINSKVQVYDCLHSIKRYLQSQQDTLGISLISEIMISFMVCDDTLH